MSKECAFYSIDPNQIQLRMGEGQLKRWWVAEQAGIHRTTLRRWIKGEIRSVRKERVAVLARVLNVEPADIVQLGKS